MVGIHASAARSRVQSLFNEWGALTVFITRTFMSYLAPVASLVAGMSQYRLSKFLVIAFVGRLLWTAAYLGFGYEIGADWEAATSFLTNFSALILCLILLVMTGVVASGKYIKT